MTARRALVTGGSRGIGRAIVERLEVAGAAVVAPTRAELDLSEPESIRRFLATDSAFDILVNNAGINIIKPLEAVRLDDVRRINAINLEAPLLLMQGVLRHMKSQAFGRIVNVSSIWGVRSKEHRALYSGTKFGLIGYTRALARELAGSGVLVNAVCPGFTDTELTEASLTPTARAELLAQVPLGRLATRSEIAGAVVSLASEANTFITGQALVVDGGFLA